MPPTAQELWEGTLEAQRLPWAVGTARVTVHRYAAAANVRFAWKARDRTLLRRAVRVRIEDGIHDGKSVLILQGDGHRHDGFRYSPGEGKPRRQLFDELDGMMLPPPLRWGDLFLLPHPDAYTPTLRDGVHPIGGVPCVGLDVAPADTASPERTLWMTECDLGDGPTWVEIAIEEYGVGGGVPRTIGDIVWSRVARGARLATRWTVAGAAGSPDVCTIELAPEWEEPSDAIFTERALPVRF